MPRKTYPKKQPGDGLGHEHVNDLSDAARAITQNRPGSFLSGKEGVVSALPPWVQRVGRITTAAPFDGFLGIYGFTPLFLNPDTADWELDDEANEGPLDPTSVGATVEVGDDLMAWYSNQAGYWIPLVGGGSDGILTIRFKILTACCAEKWARVEILSYPGSATLDFEGVDHWTCGNGKSFTAATNDVITSAGHGYSNIDPVRLCNLTGADPLVEFTTYYVRDATTNTFKLETLSGSDPIDITSSGSGTVHKLDLTVNAFEVIVWDPTEGFLNEPNADLVDRQGFATGPLTRTSLLDDPVACMPARRWEITHLLCDEAC